MEEYNCDSDCHKCWGWGCPKPPAKTDNVLMAMATI